MKIQDFLSIDLSLLNDEVINAIYHGVMLERNRRRTDNIQSSKKLFCLKNRSHSIKSKYRLKEIDALLEEDWSEIYPRVAGQEKKFYVYAHIDPMPKEKLKVGPFEFSGLPFYIGKGVGERMSDLKRNEGHGKEIKRLLKNGVPSSDIYCIVKDGLCEGEALELEAKLIHFFGTRFDGKNNGLLVNLDKPKSML